MNKIKHIFFFFFLCSVCLSFGLFSMNSEANTQKPLPAEQAFIFSTTIESTNKVIAHWKIAPGYYLYQNRIHLSFSPPITANIQFPEGEWKQNAAQKRYQVYSGDVQIPIQLSTDQKVFHLKVEYQGCSKDGFCYSPVHKEFTFNLSEQQVTPTVLSSKFQSLLTDQNSVTRLLEVGNISMILFVSLGIGLLLALTPCILPIVPILTSVIIGHRQPVTAQKGFWLSFSYVIGMSFAYAVAGLLVAALGHSLQVWLQNTWVISLISLLFVLLALTQFGLYYLRLPHSLQNFIHHLSRKQEAGTYSGAFLMGVISALVVSPCVTAPLVGVLLYIAETGNQFFGASVLFFIGIGMGMPLILVGLSAGKYLPKTGPWMEVIKKGFGFVMLGMAIWLFARVASPIIISLLWALFLFSLAFFFAAYLPLLIKRRVVLHGLGAIAALAGLSVILSVTPFWPGASTIMQTNSAVMVVNNVADANARIAAANAEHMPVLIDFYADWCESCISMDKNVFNQPDIQKALTGFVVLRVDLSSNKPEDDELLKYFNVIAPPTVLFFTDVGHEVNNRRIVGEVSAAEFLSRITLFYTEGCNKSAQC